LLASLGAARCCGQHPRFAFGAGKLRELAAFQALLFGQWFALFIAYENVSRLLAPRHVYFAEALPIACVGLLLNLAGAWPAR
jgi:Co/Zn/Cd efflux system component